MGYRCGNCGSFYTQTEVTTAKPPRYPWALTPAGQRTLVAQQQVGSDSPPCPGCGQRTLVIR